MLKAVLLLLLAGSVVAAIPAWQYSRHWGYIPSGLLGTALLALLTAMAFGWA